MTRAERRAAFGRSKTATAGPPMDLIPYAKDQAWKRLSSLKRERASWDGHAKELAQNLMPRSSRFFAQDRNRGGNRHNQIYDNTGLRGVRVLSAGLMSGMTSPARPWFRMEPADEALKASAAVKVWCATITRMMQDIFAQSNTYNALHSLYEELGVFGTGASILMPNFDDMIRHTSLTFGEYWLATNQDRKVDTLYREFDMSVGAMVRQFGWDNVSAQAKNHYNNRNFDHWLTVIHAIEPRMDADPKKLDSRNMPFSSIYFELDGPKYSYLRDSGFKAFPALAPRWKAVGGDVYGESPGMEVLGDAKQLQHEQLRKAQGIDYQTKPPVTAPTQAKGQEIDLLPGGVSYIDSANPNGGLKQAFAVNLNLADLLADIQDVRMRINAGFYVDLFLMLSQDDGAMTATEVAERHEEKLLMLGPVLERLHNELLTPLIDMTFEHIVQSGALPQPPPEMHGQPLNVKFVSILAQAQRAVATGAADRFVAGLGTVAALGKPEVLDKFDSDEWANWYSDSLGVDPRLIVADDKVALVRQQRAAQQQAQAEAQKNMAIAEGVGKLGSVSTQGGSSNAGADVLNALSSSGAAQGVLAAGVRSSGPLDPTSGVTGYGR
jgi:hypothetical protein